MTAKGNLAIWTVLTVSMINALPQDNCFLRTSQSSMTACLKFLQTLADSRLPGCEGSDILENCKMQTPSCPSTCAEVQSQGNVRSGIYRLCPRSWFLIEPFDAYCDLETRGGGWTVIQRRGDFGDTSDSFFRNWTDYRRGFGNLTAQFWLGNDKIFALTNQDHMMLRVELVDFENNKRFSEYKDFRIENEAESYRLALLGNFTGNAGDSLGLHKGMAFRTYDRDLQHCSRDTRGGWWYFGCNRSNLNGVYLKGEYTKASGRQVTWGTFKGQQSLKRTEMKIRPAYFSIIP